MKTQLAVSALVVVLSAGTLTGIHLKRSSVSDSASRDGTALQAQPQTAGPSDRAARETTRRPAARVETAPPQQDQPTRRAQVHPEDAPPLPAAASRGEQRGTPEEAAPARRPPRLSFDEAPPSPPLDRPEERRGFAGQGSGGSDGGPLPLQSPRQRLGASEREECNEPGHGGPRRYGYGYGYGFGGGYGRGGYGYGGGSYGR